MRIDIGGARGSTAAPGPEFVRYGGHTSCVAVAHDGERPRLLLDAGTGTRRIAKAFDGQAFDGSILLGHLHWDHIQGLPFFGAGDREDARTDVYVPGASDETDAEERLARMMSPPTFPIRPSQLRGAWCFRPLLEGHHDIEGFDVLVREIPHKGGTTVGFRVSDGTHSLAYLSDHEPVGDFDEAARTLVSGVDVLFHDAQYTPAELTRYAGYGHCAIDDAVRLAGECGVGALYLYHHHPDRTDDELDAIVANHADGPVDVRAAREGDSISLRG